MKPSQSHIHTIRNLRYHVRTWGDARAPKMFLLHGWMDVSASFQFLVDCLQREWYVVAPDWRGFGLTAWAAGGYWFPDYYADLDALLDIYQPDAPAYLVAHSMGGNVATTYAGVRPERVAKLISLEGFGASRTKSSDAPARYSRWLNELREPPEFKTYASFEEVAARLKKNNPRLTDDKARFLAQHWAKETAPGVVCTAQRSETQNRQSGIEPPGGSPRVLAAHHRTRAVGLRAPSRARPAGAPIPRHSLPSATPRSRISARSCSKTAAT